jgi:hypothetical protein
VLIWTPFKSVHAIRSDGYDLALPQVLVEKCFRHKSAIIGADAEIFNNAYLLWWVSLKLKRNGEMICEEQQVLAYSSTTKSRIH